MSQYLVRILRGRKSSVSKWFVEITEGEETWILPKSERTKKAAVETGKRWVRERGIEKNAVFLIPVQD